MESPTDTTLYKCEFCVNEMTDFYMYWVQGKVPYIDKPNCCVDCVEYEDDSDSDDEDNDEPLNWAEVKEREAKAKANE
jgi:hypothetical protein